MVELSEYPLSGELETELDLQEFGFVYPKEYLKEDLARDMSDRQEISAEALTAKFAEEAQENQVHTFHFLNQGNSQARQQELHSFITELMNEIPQEIPWLDPRMYHPFKQKTKIWMSIDALVMPQSDAFHVVVFHMLPPGGLLFKEKTGSGWAIKLKDLHTTVWMEQFAPNKTIMSHSKLDEDSIFIIEVKRVTYNTPAGDQTPNITEKDISFENVGMALLNLMMPTGEFANGNYQIPIIKDVIDFAKISDQLDGEGNAIGIVKELYENKFKEGTLLEHSSIFLSMFEEHFDVAFILLVHSQA